MRGEPSAGDHRLVYAVALNAAGRSQEAAKAVVTAFRVVMLEETHDRPVRIRLAIAARDTAMGAAVPGARGSASRAGLPQEVLQLANIHRLTRPEIAAVLRLDVRDVCVLANAALMRILQTQSLRAARRPSLAKRMNRPSGSTTVGKEIHGD